MMAAGSAAALLKGGTGLLGAADHNHGLLIDAERRLAFIACEGNAKLLVLDLDTRRVAAAFPVGANAHVVAADPSTHRRCFPLKDEGGRPLLRVMEPSASPASSRSAPPAAPPGAPRSSPSGSPSRR